MIVVNEFYWIKCDADNSITKMETSLDQSEVLFIETVLTISKTYVNSTHYDSIAIKCRPVKAEKDVRQERYVLEQRNWDSTSHKFRRMIWAQQIIK